MLYIGTFVYSFLLETRNLLFILLWFYMMVLLIRCAELLVGYSFILVNPKRKDDYIKQFRIDQKVNLL